MNALNGAGRPRGHGRRVVGIGAGLALAASVLAGCGGMEEEPAEPDAPMEEMSPDDMEMSEPAPDDDMETSEAPGAGGGDGAMTSEPEEEAAAGEVVITITEFEYTVPDTIEPGVEVTVTNEDPVGHTVTADDGTFDVDVPAGETVTFTAPEEAGEYSFFCEPHPNMVSTLTVG